MYCFLQKILNLFQNLNSLIFFAHSSTIYVKPRANGRDIVGQQLPTLLDVIYCVRLHTLLHVVGCCSAKFGLTMLGVVGLTMLGVVGLTMLGVVGLTILGVVVSVCTQLKNLFRLTWKNAGAYSQVFTESVFQSVIF